MASAPGQPSVSGNTTDLHGTENNVSANKTCGSIFNIGTIDIQTKKRRISLNDNASSFEPLGQLGDVLPILNSPDYYIFPSLKHLYNQSRVDPGYITRVSDFTIGRSGYGSVKYFGNTDVRGLDIDRIVKFHRHEVIVYEDESSKPMVGQGLNKDAEITLQLHLKIKNFGETQISNLRNKLRKIAERQGAHFVSFDSKNCEWKFSVSHFSRFGLSDDDEDDIVMDDANAAPNPVDIHSREIVHIDKDAKMNTTGPLLCHSLPAHLGLDPSKMKELKMLMFPEEEEMIEDFDEVSKIQKRPFGTEQLRLTITNSSQKMAYKSSPPTLRKTPLALIEYNHGSLDSTSSGAILMSQKNNGIHLHAGKADGFKLDLKNETPVTVHHSHNIIDAGLFMGRSFRVGWGPNGVLVHTGNPVHNVGSQRVLSSIVYMEKVAFDKVVRDENNKVREELVDCSFDSMLALHQMMNHEIREVGVGSFKLKLQKVVSNRLMLSEICRSYIDIVERQLELPGLSFDGRLYLTHQIMVWELIKVLFADRENVGKLRSLGDDSEEDMMQDVKEGSPQFDTEALSLIRRAEFSCWLQESVFPGLRDEISSLNESNYLEHIFLLLTGRQLDTAVELAASKGDVRLACLLSQAGGSTVSRSDVALQLNLWRRNGMDFRFIEEERIRLFELLGGNIHKALHGISIDWKRFLGLLMWYELQPDTPLSTIFQTYQHLLESGRAPYPFPHYTNEGFLEEAVNCNSKNYFDISYFLMLLHAKEHTDFVFLKSMFSSFSSTHDRLDYHMIWHQRSVLEAVGVISSRDLHILDMGLVAQLLCLGKSHLAIYVVLHIPFLESCPHLHAKVIREILFQYCESWSGEDSQIQFIENLGVPRVWLCEAMAVYYNYCGDLLQSLKYFIECRHWQKAHTLFMISVAHTLFLSGQHTEIWQFAISMEDHKSEIENWDLGAGIYISFYSLRSALQENKNTMNELDSLESRNAACADFLSQLNVSLAVWGGRLPVEARVVYSKMGEEIGGLLVSAIGDASAREVQLSCFDTVFTAPIPEDLRSAHLQDAVSLFTCYLSEMAS